MVFFLMKKLHYKFYKYILTRPYPFDHWLSLLTAFVKLWLYSIFFSLISSFVFETRFVDFIVIYFVINFFVTTIIVLGSYKLDFFKLIYHTIDQVFRITIGRLFGIKPKNYNYKSIDQSVYYGKNVSDFEIERSKVFIKKYEEIDFLVLNDYISIEEGNKKTDELMKKELSVGFYHELNGYYVFSEV